MPPTSVGPWVQLVGMSLAEIYVLYGYFWKSDENAASFLHAAGVGKSHLFDFLGCKAACLGQ